MKDSFWDYITLLFKTNTYVNITPGATKSVKEGWLEPYMGSLKEMGISASFSLWSQSFKISLVKFW